MNILDYETIFDYRGESYNSACDKFPEARHFERQALIDLIDLRSDLQIVDAPAGGGYLADGIREIGDDSLTISCIEPAANFGKRIHSSFAVINSPIDNIPLADSSIDLVASLAGLHHIPDRAPVFKEWARLLKPGGQIAVADVAAGSGPDEFLNGFVDQYTPQGHDGIFIENHEFSTLFQKHGLEPQQDKIVSVPWLFDSHQDLAEFCTKLFYLVQVEPEQVLTAVDKCVGIKNFGDKVGMEWELRYASGIRTENV